MTESAHIRHPSDEHIWRTHPTPTRARCASRLALPCALARDRSVRAIVLRGEGPSFCSGLDFGSFTKRPAQLARAFVPTGATNLFQEACWAWRKVQARRVKRSDGEHRERNRTRTSAMLPAPGKGVNIFTRTFTIVSAITMAICPREVASYNGTMELCKTRLFPQKSHER